MDKAKPLDEGFLNISSYARESWACCGSDFDLAYHRQRIEDATRATEALRDHADDRDGLIGKLVDFATREIDLFDEGKAAAQKLSAYLARIALVKAGIPEVPRPENGTAMLRFEKNFVASPIFHQAKLRVVQNDRMPTAIPEPRAPASSPSWFVWGDKIYAIAADGKHVRVPDATSFLANNVRAAAVRQPPNQAANPA